MQCDDRYDSQLRTLRGKDDDPSTLTFLPWVGNQYAVGFPGFDRKVMVVPESHYDPARDDIPRDPIESFTRREVARQVSQGEASDKFWRNVADVFGFVNRRGELWSHIAFFNLLQILLADNAAKKTDAAMAAGAHVLMSVLPILRPDLVIVLGKGTWRASIGESTGHKIDVARPPQDASSPDDSREVWHLKTAEPGFVVPAIHLLHPSPRTAFDAAQWAPLVQRFLGEQDAVC